MASLEALTRRAVFEAWGIRVEFAGRGSLAGARVRFSPKTIDFMHPSAFAKVLILTAFAGWLISLMLIPLVRRFCRQVGLVDNPDPTRKLHTGAVALGGGIAIFLTSGLVYLFAIRGVFPELGVTSGLWSERFTGLTAASAAILLLGIIDDRFVLRGKTKLAGQMLIVSAFAWFTWSPSGEIVLFSYAVPLAGFTFPLVVLWLLVCINAVNLIDGADGAAGSFSLVACFGIVTCAFVTGNVTVAVVATAVGASLAGFLCFNRPPASIFLGDAGSMLLGLALGTLACWSVERVGQPQDILIPITLMGVPLFDSVVAIMRRMLTGRSIYAADRGHLHHILGTHFKNRGLSPTWMIIAFGGLTTLTSIGAVVGIIFRSDLCSVLAIGIVVSGLVWSRVFGHAEARLLASHTRRVGGSLISRVRRDRPQRHVSGVSLQGDRQWDGVWMPLVDFAEKNGLWRLTLDLNLSWQHEGYHGYWSHGDAPEKSDQWSVRLPIICQRQSVGRLEIIGEAVGKSQIESLESFSFLISELQPEIERLVEHLTTHPAAEVEPESEPQAKPVLVSH